MELTIKHKRPYDFVNSVGSQITGNTYGALRPDGTGVTFTSPNEYEVGEKVEIALDEIWDEQRARIKYREKAE